ncbi:MAG: hypothetical protein IPG90_06515 [Bacteroidetes bacterium]|nr:hypothetical protein [Bacteroidota bacterium]
MGSAPATKLSAEPRSMTPSKLMLEAPFANAETMVQDGSGLALPGSTVTDLQINNAEEIKHITTIFLIHGEADDFVNINTHGAIVYANYNGTYAEKRIVFLPQDIVQIENNNRIYICIS